MKDYSKFEMSETKPNKVFVSKSKCGYYNKWARSNKGTKGQVSKAAAISGYLRDVI